MRKGLVLTIGWPVLAAGFAWGLWQRRRVLQRSLGGLLVLGLACAFFWSVETALVWLATRPPRPTMGLSSLPDVFMGDADVALGVCGPLLFTVALATMVLSFCMPGLPGRTLRLMGILGMAVPLVARAMTF